MNADVARLIDEILEFHWSVSPTSATAAGIHEHDHRLADCDRDAIGARVRALSAYRQRLARLAASLPSLAPDEALDVAVLGNALEVETRLLEEVRVAFRDPSYYLDEILYGAYYLVQREFAPLPDRARVVAQRLGEVPRLLRQAEANLSHPDEIPPAWAIAAIEQFDGSLAFLAGLDRQLAPGAGAASTELRARARDAVQALQEFGRHLRDWIAPRAAGRFSIGRSLFEFLLRRQHGVDLDAEDLHEFGRSLIARTQERLAEAVRAIDPERSWQELVSEWKTDHPAREGLLGEYRAEVARARSFVRERGLVTLPEGERLRVTETPAFQRSVCPFAAYLPAGPFENDQEGFLWVTPPSDDAPPDLRERILQDHLRPAIAGAVVHEAYPGHHLQLTVTNRIESKVRRCFATPVLVEGWAFYCEQLMAEHSYYLDPRSRVLQLKDELWRACRVVIDISLHARDMTFDEAAGMLHGVARIEVPSARAEILRYARSATQPMSYAIGKREILRLREDWERLRGSSFDLKSFHDRLLSFGSIPIALIRERMLRDAAAQG
jgi:uncharacterized protein (DUF885 family)